MARDLVTSAAALVLTGGKIQGEASATREIGLPTDAQTWVFDLASLTKPLIATTALALVGAGRCQLEWPLSRLVPELPSMVGRRSIAAFLAHRSGLAAWTSLAARGWDDVAELARGVDGAGLCTAPPATYSDLGYLVVGLGLERREDRPLAEIVAERVAKPLGMRGLSGPPAIVEGADGEAGAGRRVVPCRLDRSREVELAQAQALTLGGGAGIPAPGRPQDGNADFLGALCGHAGAFGGIEDVAKLAAEWLTPQAVLTPQLVEHALRYPTRGRFACGWWRRRVSGAAGRALGARAFGHLGFTGGSVWIDPARDLLAVLLAHRTSVEVDLTAARQEFHVLAARATDVGKLVGPGRDRRPTSRNNSSEEFPR